MESFTTNGVVANLSTTNGTLNNNTNNQNILNNSSKMNSTNNNKRQHPSNLSSSSTSSVDSSISYHHHHNHHHHLHTHTTKNLLNNRELNSRNSFPDLNNVSFSSSASGLIQNNDDNECGLTQAGLEEYSRSYYEHHPIVFNHQKQSSYAQSEGYHSYVSSSDSSSTPFLDRLRQDSEVLLSRASQWSQEIQSSINNISDNNSSESTSSTETLKWHGSLSDVSVASHATNTSIISGSGSSQLIAHSSRVLTPKRHNSESVLYMADDGQLSVNSSQGGSTDTLNIINETLNNKEINNSQKSNRNNNRLFPISTYIESSPTSPINENGINLNGSYVQSNNNINNNNNNNRESLNNSNSSNINNNNSINLNNNGTKVSPTHNWQSVAERINELERQYSSSNQNQKYSYLDPSKTHRVSNPSLKAFQKNAVKSYFQRQQSFKGQTNNGNIQNGVQTRTSPVNANGNQLARPQSLQLSDISKSSKISPRTSLPNFGSINNIPVTVKSSYGSPPISQSSNNLSSSNIITSPTKINNNKHPSSPTISSYSLSESQHNLINSSRSINMDMNPPPPPPRTRIIMPTRRTSSASEYATSREQIILRSKQNLSKDLLGPMIMGPIISVDDWVPERPPKNPLLRVPSPELPPPPVTINENETHLINQDEPLPPPPPEIFKHSRQFSIELEEKPNNVASRRNSFAGSSNKKTLYRSSTTENTSPPIIMKKPIPLINHITNNTNAVNGNINIVAQRPSSSFAKQHAQKALKVLLNNNNNNKNDTTINNPIIPNRMVDSRLSLRKRSHNSQTTIETAPTKGVVTPPPPLKPRMSLFSNDKFGITNKTSLKSTSYHPKHAFEKQQSQIDLDQGVYKRTVSMNEDYCINNNTNKTSISNLPDVLPDGAKNSHSRYSNKIQSQPSTPLSPINKPVFHYQSDTNCNNVINNNIKNILNESQENVSPVILTMENGGLSPSSPKYTTESSIDLKKTKILDSKTRKNIENDFRNNRQLSQSPILNQITNNKNDINRKLSVDNYINNGNCNKIQNNKINQEIENKLKENQNQNEKISLSMTSLNSYKSDNSSNSNDSINSINSIDSNLSNENLSNEKQDEIINQLAEISMNETNNKESLIIMKDNDSPPVKVLSELKIPPICKESDELKLLQKTEIVLRVNALTSEVASQTDDILLPENPQFNCDIDDMKSKIIKSTMLTPRQKLPEEIECDNISKELISHLSPSDKLYNVLAPPVQKTTSDYVTGLYNANIPCRPAKKDASTTTLEICFDNHIVKCTNFSTTTTSVNSTQSTTQSSSYFNLSETKSKVIPRYSREMTLLNGDSCDLMKKKEELLNRLNKKLFVLSNEQTTIAEEIIANDNLGNNLAIAFAQKLKPNDSSKLRSYIDDIGHITMLLLSLSSRLARIENSLHIFSDGSTEKKMLEVKRDRLVEQLDEAKRLKDDINRRGIIISSILDKHLTNDELSDYEYFINMKAKLLVDSREISDKIKYGEEQLIALKDTMVHSEC